MFMDPVTQEFQKGHIRDGLSLPDHLRPQMEDCGIIFTCVSGTWPDKIENQGSAGDVGLSIYVQLLMAWAFHSLGRVSEQKHPITEHPERGFK